ncbi:MAG: 4Fe-4S binding protein [Planctomycetes bacterium]|nr:4Fe-4S binding protein [Planctomycetota bacterium]
MTATTRATISAKPEAELAPRDGDDILHSDELKQFELFGELKKPISVEKFPGSIVLRQFRKGEVICRQGDRGHSAFYIVHADDLRRLSEFRARPEADSAIAEPTTSEDGDKVEASHHQVATAYILSGQTKASSGFLSNFFSRSSQSADQVQSQFIPNDGPTDIDYATRQAAMCEGDVFGEMSCMTLAPRSATIVVDEDCYMVEFLRNIFDQMQRDVGYRQKTDELYATRVLSTHLRRLELFQDLTDEQIEVLRQASHLEVVEPGTVICNEGDQSDSVYLIRSGVVQVVRGAHVAFRVSDVADWPAFCQSLLESDATKDRESDESALTKPAVKSSAKSAAARGKGTASDRVGNDKPVSASVADILAAAKKPASREATTADASDADELVSVLVAQAPKSLGDPKQSVWSWFLPRVQTSIRAVAIDNSSSDRDRQLVVQAVNELIRRREFVSSADILPVIEQSTARATFDSFPKGIPGAKKQWSELEVRLAGALAFRELLGETLSKVTGRTSSPDILAYLSRGDCFGEMAAVLDVPRQATCIAYDHPTDDSNRKPGRVELVRIERAAFQKLLDDSPPLRASVDKLVSKRYADIVGSDLRQAGDTDTALTHSEEFRDEGLAQGQNLLLIDLDRCTRCGDCVRACVNTHDDGYSRLFLDGPRFDRFLVPSACRQCLNPSCMIGCPVGSIQRGANGQIEIRDWCIGCSLCARQCPYDSIQMHDLGIIAEESVGWQFAATSQVGDAAWQDRRYRPSGWSVGVAPFNWTIDFFEALASSTDAGSWQTIVGLIPESICFRHEFQLSREQLAHKAFALGATSKGLVVRAWINGQAITSLPPANPKKKRKDDDLQAQIESSQLRVGANLLAIEICPVAAEDGECFAPKYGQLVLSARLDPLPAAGELALATVGEGVDLEVELVKKQAVVCDLCSSLSSQRPACVDQCPHEAAIRVDARFDFPSRF